MADWTEAASPLAGEICADTPHQNIYTLSFYISGFRADGWMDTDLEGLAGEDRQMRREGEKDKMSHTMSEYKSGAWVCENTQSALGNSVRGAEALNSLHARIEKMWLDGADVTETVLKQKFNRTADNTACVYQSSD